MLGVKEAAKGGGLLKRGTGIWGIALNLIEEVFGSAQTPNWVTTPYRKRGTLTASDVKDIAAESSVKQRGNQTGSYTIYFQDGHKYHGKGSISRMITSALDKIGTYGQSVIFLDWTPALSNREAFKQEYHRMQTDRIPNQYEEGYRNPINYNLIQSPGKKYILQDGY